MEELEYYNQNQIVLFVTFNNWISIKVKNWFETKTRIEDVIEFDWKQYYLQP